MDYLETHPDAILNMDLASANNLIEAAKLAGMSAEHAEALGSLGDNVLTSLLSGVAAVRLVQRVCASVGISNVHGTAGYRAENQAMADMFIEHDKNKEEQQGKGKSK